MKFSDDEDPREVWKTPERITRLGYRKVSDDNGADFGLDTWKVTGLARDYEGWDRTYLMRDDTHPDRWYLFYRPESEAYDTETADIDLADGTAYLHTLEDCLALIAVYHLPATLRGYALRGWLA